MAFIDEIRESNALIKSQLGGIELVAVFVGGTSGIGEATLKQFAKHADKPRVYFLGRSQEAGDRIAQECHAINPDGQYTFMPADLSLLKNVDQACDAIKAKEKHINILFLSIGTFGFGKTTAEGLHLPPAVVHYARLRFMLNLLQPLREAAFFRRVVSVFAGTKEGAVNTVDWQTVQVKSMAGYRGHMASIATLDLEQMARRAPEISFVHSFPGLVRGGTAREAPWFMKGLIKTASAVFGAFTYIPSEDSGDFHTYLATSAAFPPAMQRDVAMAGVKTKQCGLHNGSDGSSGSGMYTVDERGSTPDQSVQALRALRDAGVPAKLWQHTLHEYCRILGLQCLSDYEKETLDRCSRGQTQVSQ